MMWIAATLIAAAAQTARNAAQRDLTGQVGTLGATAVRFLFGLPFAAVFLALWAGAHTIALPNAAVLGWTSLGALSQIAATALMLLTMRSRGFGVSTALLKTEPVTLALTGALILNEPLGPARLAAIATATVGVLLISGTNWRQGGWRPVGLGVVAGALFGLSAIGFRGAILALPAGDQLTRAATVLVLGLLLQSVLMLLWLGIAQRPALRAIAANWRTSLLAGALGAFASLFWFLGFALTAAANVRTLALVEVPMAQFVSGRVFREGIGARQAIGMALVVLGVGALIAVSVGR